MKKMFFTVLMGLCMLSVLPDAWAACNSPTVLAYHSSQDYDDDEFLYPSSTEYEKAKSGYESTNKMTSGSGVGYECDGINAAVCGNEETITLNPGHVFEGVVVPTKVTYQCKSGLWGTFGQDRWEAVNDYTCDTKFGKISVGECVTKSGGGCRELTDIECSGYQLTDSAGTAFHGICRAGPTFVCKAVKCRDGLVADNGVCKAASGGGAKKCPSGRESGAIWEVGCDGIGIANGVKCGKRCNSDGTETNFVTECQKDYNLDELVGIGDVWKGKYKRCVKSSGGGNDNRGSGQSSLQKCLQSRATEKGKACCYASRAVATYDAAKDECKCVAEGQEFDYAARECKTKVVPGKNFQCDEVYLNSLLKYKTTCKDSKEIMDLVKKIEDLCKGQNPSASLFDEYVRQLGKLNPEDCGKVVDDDDDNDNEVVIDVVTESRGKILSASAELDRIASGFGVSVWKNKDGNFNTSRLVSDSVAGVVLGTAGGLITSNVVKKNQIKGGFEDIQCTVGGQVVAGWGDEFRVGIQ